MNDFEPQCVEPTHCGFLCLKERQVRALAKENKKIADLIAVEGVDCKGYGIIAKLVTTDTDLCIGAKALYAYLCSYAGSGTTAYPRRSKILADLKMSKETYYKYQRELIDQGYIKATRGDKYPFPNTYTIVARPPKVNTIKTEPNNSNEDILISRGIKSMGYGTVPKAVMLDERLHYKAKALYAYFCSFAGNGTTAIPSRDTICYHMQFTINSFQRYIRELIQYNYIEVQQTKYRGRFSNNIYYINDLPDEEKGHKEIEHRSEIQEMKSSKQATKIIAEDEGVNIDTSKDNKQKSDISPKNTDVDFNNNSAEDTLKLREVYSAIIKDNIGYDYLLENDDINFKNMVDVVFNIMLDTVTSDAKYIKIRGNNMPVSVVKSRFLKLEYENIEYVINSLLSTTTRIKNIPAYIISCLYSSTTDEFYWSNRFEADHKEGKI